MARPRLHTDDDLLSLVGASLARSGRGGWTLSEVATEAGVHAATLVKRFGSKRGLLLALSRRWLSELPRRSRTDDPGAELLHWLKGTVRSPANRSRAVADMAMLMEDLVDDELSSLLASGWEIQMNYISGLLNDARSQGLFTRAPRSDLAAVVILDVVNGGAVRVAAYPSNSVLGDTSSVAIALLASWA